MVQAPRRRLSLRRRGPPGAARAPTPAAGLRALWCTCIIAAALWCACTKSGGTRAAPLDAVQADLAAAGLTLEAFAPVDAKRFSAWRCLAGRVDGLEALACEYGDGAAARAARPRCEAWIGGALTGVAFERDRVLLVLADRAGADRSGKTLARIGRAFLGAP